MVHAIVCARCCLSAKCFFTILLFTLCIVAIKAQNVAWQLKKEEDGIKVYAREIENTSLKEIKTEVSYLSTLSGVVAALSDKDGYPEWVYNCAEGKILQKTNESDGYHYQRTHVPWPFADRDMVIYTTVTQNPVTHVVEIVANGHPNYLPPVDGVVRVPGFKAYWTLVSAEGKVSVTHIVSIDPGGDIPPWLLNLAVAEGPLKTMKNLRRRLPAYQHVRLSYISE